MKTKTKTVKRKINNKNARPNLNTITESDVDILSLILEKKDLIFKNVEKKSKGKRKEKTKNKNKKRKEKTKRKNEKQKTKRKNEKKKRKEEDG